MLEKSNKATHAKGHIKGSCFTLCPLSTTWLEKTKIMALTKLGSSPSTAQVDLLVVAIVLFPTTSPLSIFLLSEGNCKPQKIRVLQTGAERKAVRAEAQVHDEVQPSSVKLRKVRKGTGSHRQAVNAEIHSSLIPSRTGPPDSRTMTRSKTNTSAWEICPRRQTLITGVHGRVHVNNSLYSWRQKKELQQLRGAGPRATRSLCLPANTDPEQIYP